MDILIAYIPPSHTDIESNLVNPNNQQVIIILFDTLEYQKIVLKLKGIVCIMFLYLFLCEQHLLILIKLILVFTNPVSTS